MSRRSKRKGQAAGARGRMEAKAARAEGAIEEAPEPTPEPERPEAERAQALPVIGGAPEQGGGSAPDAKGDEGHGRGGMRGALAASAAIALAAACACGAAAWHAMPHEGSEAPEQVQATVELEEPAEEHVHEWSPLTETVRHDAVTSTVRHPAEYAQQTAYHTVCNECGEVIDNAAEQHVEATGHSGYTVNVPREETVLTKDAWSEVVVVQDAYDEVVVKGSICLGCGEVQAVHDAQ